MRQHREARFFHAVLILGLAGATLAQTPGQSAGGPASPSTPATKASEITQNEVPAIFKARVDVVFVPVVVRNNQGQTIGNLTKENFQVQDKGKPQEITRFTAENGPRTEVKAPAATTAEGEASASPNVPDRFVAYVFDDLHLTWDDLIRARDAAGRQIANLAKSERAAIFTTSGLIHAEFTDDIEKLRSTLRRLRNRSRTAGLPPCPDISYYMADLIVSHDDKEALAVAIEETAACMRLYNTRMAVGLARGMANNVFAGGRQETQASLSTLKDVVRRLAGMPGQRIAILISPGFFSPDEFHSDQDDILAHAIKAQVLINSLDARGVWVDPTNSADRTRKVAETDLPIKKQQYDHRAASMQADVLAEIADGTGGSLFQNNNDLDQGLRELAAAPDSYYILEFSPQNLKYDGSFHPLKVAVKTSPPLSLNVQFRKGYYAPTKRANSEDTAKAEIEQAMFAREELNGLPVKLGTQYFKNGKDATLTAICRVDPRQVPFRKADGRNLNILTIVTALFDHNGNYITGHYKTVDFKLEDDTLARVAAGQAMMTFKTNFTVDPGSYTIRLVVRDSERQMMSALSAAVAIP